MIGLDVTNNVVLNSKLEKILQESNNELAQFIFKITRQCASFDREHNNTDGAIMHDVCTIMYLLDNNLIKVKDTLVEVSIEDENLGQSILCNKEKNNCKVAYDIDVKKIYQIYLKTLFDIEFED